jgi:hypothetical protein
MVESWRQKNINKFECKSCTFNNSTLHTDVKPYLCFLCNANNAEHYTDVAAPEAEDDEYDEEYEPEDGHYPYIGAQERAELEKTLKT